MDAKKILELTVGQYSAIRSDYWAKMYDAAFSYLSGGGNITVFQNGARSAIGYAYPATGDLAWQDGGSELPLDDDANSFVASMQSAELGYVNNTAERLKLLKKGGEFDASSEAWKIADGYSATLDALYANIKVMAAGSKMLTFTGSDGDHSCSDCQRYQGQRHRASWWVSHDAVPPNRSFECGGYRCEHILVDDDGNLFTI